MRNRTFLSVASAAMLAAGPLYAADKLGGGCCADLEERVAELEATTARKGNRRMSLEVYGQVHAGMFFHNIDEAPREKKSVIDGAQSQTRFGFRGSSKINQDVSAGFVLEVGVGGFEEYTGASTGDLAKRLAYVHITSKSLGSISLGTQSLATDGILEMDLSNSAIASSPLSFAPADSALVGMSVSPLDGYRGDAIKYSTPLVGGFQLQAAWVSEDVYDVALRYAGEFGQIRVAAGVGYREDLGSGILAGVDSKTLGGSASIMHTTSGLFLSGSYAQQELEGLDDLKAYALRGGLETSPFKLGKTTLYIEWAEYKQSGGTGTIYGAGIVQSIDAAAMDIYLSYKKVDDVSILDIGEEDVFMAGARVKF